MKTSTLLKPLFYGLSLTILVNLILYYIGKSLGFINNDELQKSGNSLQISTVILYNSIVPVLASVIALSLSYRLLKRPLSIFKIVGGVALLLSIAMTVARPASSVGYKIIATAMILVPAAAVGYFLLNLFDKSTALKKATAN